MRSGGAQFPAGTAALAGAALLYRGATVTVICIKCSASTARRGHGTGTTADRDRTPDSSSAAAPLLVEESITINTPVDRVFRFWRDFETCRHS